MDINCLSLSRRRKPHNVRFIMIKNVFQRDEILREHWVYEIIKLYYIKISIKLSFPKDRVEKLKLTHYKKNLDAIE